MCLVTSYDFSLHIESVVHSYKKTSNLTTRKDLARGKMDVYASDFLLASIFIVLLCSINELIGMFEHVVDAMSTHYSITFKRITVRKQVVRQKDGFTSSATNSQPSEPMAKGNR